MNIFTVDNRQIFVLSSENEKVWKHFAHISDSDVAECDTSAFLAALTVLSMQDQEGGTLAYDGDDYRIPSFEELNSLRESLSPLDRGARLETIKDELKE